PLAADERRDVLRAGIGFVLGEDPIGLGRLREKYAGKIANGPDRHAFDVITAPIEANGSEFREVARLIASIDTLDAFLRDLRSLLAGPATRLPGAPRRGDASRAAHAAGGARPQGRSGDDRQRDAAQRRRLLAVAIGACRRSAPDANPYHSALAGARERLYVP